MELERSGRASMPVDTAHLKRAGNGRVRYQETIPDPALGEKVTIWWYW